jgi:hypothetical protein
MELPRTLYPWREWLTWLPPELAAYLGAILIGLNSRIGALRPQRARAGDNFEGLGDIRRRGAYARLLSSEWLLADEMPDEFLRRAANTEHLFLSPTYRALKSQSNIIALFDAGPLQLGPPRLVHVAMWILLARRAREANGQLRWGLTHEPNKLYPANTREDLRSLLEGRCFKIATKENEQQWNNSIAEQSKADDECWYLGPTAWFQATHQMLLQPAVGGGAVEVKLHHRHRIHEFSLALPATKAAADVLHARFDITTLVPISRSPIPYRFAITRAPIISNCGKSIALVALDTPGMLSLRIPERGKHGVSKFRLQKAPKSSVFLAVAFQGKSLGGIVSIADRLDSWQLPEVPKPIKPSSELFKASPGRADWLPFVRLTETIHQQGHNGLSVSVNKSVLFLCDEVGQLVMFPEMSVVSSGVCGLQKTRYGFVFAAPITGENNTLAIHRYRGKQLLSTAIIPNSTLQSKVYFAKPDHFGSDFGPFAISMPDAMGGSQKWHLHADQLHSYAELSLSSGWKVYGAHYDYEQKSTSLVCLSADKKCLVLMSHEERQILYTAPSKIVQCSFCTDSGIAALLTADRRLIVFSVPEREIRAEVRGSDA